jgi:hypothetical protein
VLYVKDNGQAGIEEVTYGLSFTGSDGALHGYQCIELWTEADLNKVGVYKVQPATPPTDPEVKISGYHFGRVNNVITQVLDLIQPAAPTAGALKDYAAARRFDLEVGGMVSNTFGPLLTDRDTRALIAQTIQSIDLNIVQAPINWKASTGFVQLDRASFVAIATEVAAFVQTTFDKEAEADDKIKDGVFTTKAQIDDFFFFPQAPLPVAPADLPQAPAA